LAVTGNTRIGPGQGIVSLNGERTLQPLEGLRIIALVQVNSREVVARQCIGRLQIQ